MMSKIKGILQPSYRSRRWRHGRMFSFSRMDRIGKFLVLIGLPMLTIAAVLFYYCRTQIAFERDILYVPQNNNGENLWFMHIIKTGGTWAYEKYFDRLAINYDLKADECGAKKHELKGSMSNVSREMFTGYFHANLGEFHHCFRDRFVSKDNVLATQLRHPVERVISEYYFYKVRNNEKKRDKINWWTEEMIRTSLKEDFMTWVQDPRNMAHNRQAFWFLYDLETHGKRTIVGRPDDTLDWWKSQDKSTQEMKLMLKKRIHENFRFISIMEEPEISDEVFSSIFGKKAVQSMKKSHASGKPSKISDEIREEILERNKLDLWLWEYVKAKLVESHGSIRLSLT